MLKKIVQHRVFIATVFFIFGIFAHIQYQNLLMKFGFLSPMLGLLSHNSPALNPFVDEQDPFAQMQKMQEQMMNQFGQGNHFQIQTNDLGEMKQREDVDNIYLDIELNQMKPKTMNVEIVDGNIVIQGQLEAKNEEGMMNTYMSSSFHRSFPIPDGVDAQKFKMNQENDKIVIQFPKTKN